MIPTTASRIPDRLREEALLLLDGRGALLDAAREISGAFRDREIVGAVIGGIAVLLHGYVRTTTDIDLFVPGPLEAAASVLKGLGFVHDRGRRMFVRDGLPVYLVTLDQWGAAPTAYLEIKGVATVSLPDLIARKLRSGSENLLRAIDLADVIGLIRANGLSGSFASNLPKDVRPAYRKLIKAFDAEGERRS
jgi:hypothetical protein